MTDLEILGIYFAHFRFFKMMHQQSFIWTSTVLTIRTHQLLVCSWKFILSNHFSRSMSLYHLVITWDVSSWKSMSSSSFRFIPHQPLLFYTLRSIRNMLFLSFCVTISPQILSFTHSLYATSPFLPHEVWYLGHRRALLLLSSKYKVYFHYHRYI